MADINEIRLDQAMKIEMETLWDCHKHDYWYDEHIEECLSEMLSAYIGDERNYAVDRAEIECTEMCKVSHCIKYENGKTKLYNVLNAPKGIERDYAPPGKEEGKAFYFGRDTDTNKVRRLFTLHAQGASDNGIRFGTVVDRKCLRDVREGVVEAVTPDDGIPAACEANIISCGNCRIMRVSDIAEIEKRWDESMEYGTCYSLIKPVAEWLNPLCAESVAGNCDAENTLALNTGLIEVGPTRPSCVITEHHKVLEFDTQYGKKEGLTMLSTLLCTRGGIITIKVHGQIYVDGSQHEEGHSYYGEAFSYIDKDGNVVTVVWTISEKEFLDASALTLTEIEKICNSHNPELVSRGFAEGIYNYCNTNGLNPKILLATLGQEQGWCLKGNYEKAFGVGPGGNPRDFSDSKTGIAASGNAFIKLFNEGVQGNSLLLKGINRDAGPNYPETKAACEDLNLWQSGNSKYVRYMEAGQDIECVNAAMYAKLRYTPWVDFPPQNSHPLEDWLHIYDSLEECLTNGT